MYDILLSCFHDATMKIARIHWILQFYALKWCHLYTNVVCLSNPLLAYFCKHCFYLISVTQGNNEGYQNILIFLFQYLNYNCSKLCFLNLFIMWTCTSQRIFYYLPFRRWHWRTPEYIQLLWSFLLFYVSKWYHHIFLLDTNDILCCYCVKMCFKSNLLCQHVKYYMSDILLSRFHDATMKIARIHSILHFYVLKWSHWISLLYTYVFCLSNHLVAYFCHQHN